VTAVGGAPGELEVDAENWVSVLVPDLPAEDAAALGPDQDILFEALAEVLSRGEMDGVAVEVAEGEPTVAADAALFLPGARIHIQATGAAKQLVTGMARLAVFSVLGDVDVDNEVVGASIGAAIELFSKVSRLEPADVEVVAALASLNRGRTGATATDAELRRVLPGVEGLEDRLDALRERGVLERRDDGWAVSL